MSEPEARMRAVADTGRGPLAQLRVAAGDAVADARAAWSTAGGRAWLFAALAVAGLALPLYVRDPAQRQSVAAGLYVVLAAVGLNVAVGMAGMASLGQGAFVGLGAFAVALLRVKAGWDPTLALLAAVALSAAAGLVVGAGAVRLRGAFVAVATWVVSWLLAFALSAFPGMTGGAQGLPVPQGTLGVGPVGAAVRLTPGVHLELAFVLAALALAGFAAASRGRPGLALAALRDESGAATVIGLESARLRLGAFTVSAVLGGLAGALSVELVGVADPTAYGPLLSVELFVAVLLGGEGTILGPVVGAFALVVVPRTAQGLGSMAGVDAQRFEPVIAAALLLVALLVGRGGVMRLAGQVADRLHGWGLRRRPPENSRVSMAGADPLADWKESLSRRVAHAPALAAVEVVKAYGGVMALDRISLEVAPGGLHAVIGPNGSGKTTLLRVIAGSAPPDSGRVQLDGEDVTDWSIRERVRAGLSRTLARPAIFQGLSVAQGVEAAMDVRRTSGGAVRTVLATPRERAEAHELARRAMALLSLVGLEGATALRPSSLTGEQQRRLMLAMALASLPRVVLLDEPSAGMSHEESERFAGLLRTIHGLGMTMLVVEHNLALVHALAERVTVLDAGRIIADGTAEEVARDPLVIDAYLGQPAG